MRTRAPDAAWAPPAPEDVVELAGASYSTMRAIVSALSPLGDRGRHISRREARRLLAEARGLCAALEAVLAEPGTDGAASPDRLT